MALKKGYTQIEEQMKNWLPTRYFAAYAEINNKDCKAYINLAVSNLTKADEMCTNLPFNDLSKAMNWALAPKMDEMKT